MQSLVGRHSHTTYDESIAGRHTWLRLHNRERSPMNAPCQAFPTLQPIQNNCLNKTDGGQN